MAWDRLQRAWSALLRDFPERTTVIMAASPGNDPFVQATTLDEASVQVEASGHDLPAEVQRALSAGGFEFKGDFGLWSRVIEWPSRTAVYDEAARLCVEALQAQGILGPEQLVYWAWRDPEPMERGRTYSGDEMGQLDPGASDVEFAGLGIKYHRLGR